MNAVGNGSTLFRYDVISTYESRKSKRLIIWNGGSTNSINLDK